MKKILWKIWWRRRRNGPQRNWRRRNCSAKSRGCRNASLKIV